MTVNCDEIGRRRILSSCMFVVVALSVSFFARAAFAQALSTDSQPGVTVSNTGTFKMFYLANITQSNDASEVVTALRSMIPGAKIYLVPWQRAISIHGTPDDIQLAQKIISDLDRPRKLYRLTFTIKRTDSEKNIGTQSFSIVVASGEKTLFKEGSRTPIVTGAYDVASSASHSEVQYLDVGLSIEASVDGSLDGLRLHSKVEQSALSEEKSGVGPQDPVVRQSLLEATSSLILSKPLVLGFLDIPGSTRKQEISVIGELIK